MSQRRKFYLENGYWIERRAFPAETCDQICRTMKYYANKQFGMITNPDRTDFLIAQSLPNLLSAVSIISELGKKSDLIQEVFRASRLMRSVMTDRRLVLILEDIMKLEMVAITSQFFFKEAGSDYAEQAFNPHQDNAYLNLENGSSAANTQLMLADSNRENGAMWIIPGSHQENLLPFEDLATYGEKARKNPGRKCIIPDKYKGKEIDLSFTKGDYLVLDGNLIHGSHPNLSTRSRPVFAWQTCVKTDVGPALENNGGENARRTVIVLR